MIFLLAIRVISALIGVPILIAIVYFGNFILAASLLVLILLGILEFQKFIINAGYQQMLTMIIIGQVFMALAVFNQWRLWSSLSVLLIFILLVFQCLIKFPRYGFVDLSLNLFASIYIGWTLQHLMLLRNLAEGFFLLMFLFLVIWATDIGAFFAGSFWGKHKLAPLVSPNKTMEGSLGGLVLSLIVAIIFNSFFKLFSLPIILVLALSLSSVGQIGDLFESALKRLAQVKDSGKIIPGHGGILDRFDSIILATPVYYYLLLFLGIVG